MLNHVKQLYTNLVHNNDVNNYKFNYEVVSVTNLTVNDAFYKHI